jgi:signal transduction histidine kinase
LPSPERVLVRRREFQIFAAQRGVAATGVPVELFRLVLLVSSFLCLLAFGARLLPNAEGNPAVAWRLVALIAGFWLAALTIVFWRFRPTLLDGLAAGDVLARYGLAVPGAVLAGWALIRERRDFHARGMSQYGRSLLWAALAFFVYGALGQVFTRPSLVFPSQTINTALFLQVFGVPVQVLRTAAAIVIALALGSALRAFEQENRIRLARANKARLEAQAAALDAQARRAREVEALNVQLSTTARELFALVELSRILTSTVDLDRLVTDALGQVVHSLDGACGARLYTRRSDGKLEVAGDYRRSDAPPAGESPLVQAVADAAVTAHGPAGAALDGRVSPLDASILTAEMTFGTLGVPIQAQDQPFGALVLSSYSESQPLGTEALNLLSAFAQQMAAAIENARLYQVVRDREAQLEQLVRQLVTAQEGERQRIARELHDETGQKLTALVMGLAAVEVGLANHDAPTEVRRQMADLRAVADSAITELRNIMADLRPAQLDDLGLAPTLRWYLGQYAQRHPHIGVRLMADRQASRLPSHYETILFRVAQEALTNVARHADATIVTLSLSRTSDAVVLEITDNGKGFDPVGLPAVSPVRARGWGLVGMRERVALADGQFALESAPGAGTTVRVALPLAPETTPRPAHVAAPGGRP